MRYRREIEVPGTPGDVFRYLTDFEHTVEWDPGIEEARRLFDGPTAVGSRFEVIARFRGNRQRFEYVVTELDDEGRRIALSGEGAKAVSDDRVTVDGVEGRTRVTYEADLRLKGLYRIAEPFLGATFTRMGDEALEGLQARLGRALPTARA